MPAPITAGAVVRATDRPRLEFTVGTVETVEHPRCAHADGVWLSHWTAQTCVKAGFTSPLADMVAGGYFTCCDLMPHGGPWYLADDFRVVQAAEPDLLNLLDQITQETS